MITPLQRDAFFPAFIAVIVAGKYFTVTTIKTCITPPLGRTES